MQERCNFTFVNDFLTSTVKRSIFFFDSVMTNFLMIIVGPIGYSRYYTLPQTPVGSIGYSRYYTLPQTPVSQNGIVQVPSHCAWAIRDIFTMQRSSIGKDCSPAKVWNVTHEAFTDQLLRFIPHVSDIVLKIVDIGAGLAMYHIMLDKHYNGNVEHFLVDKSINEVKPTMHHKHGDWHNNDKFPFYNSMECAQSIAVANNVSKLRWHSVYASNGTESIFNMGKASMDIAISLLSCGWHYPVNTYASALAHVLKPNGILIITLRRMQKQDKELRRVGFVCTSHTWSQSNKGHLMTCHLKNVKYYSTSSSLRN